MKVYISSDHGGFNLKNLIFKYLRNKGYDIIDLGPKELNPTDDFPIFTKPVAEEVSKDVNSKGIVICRNGVGVSIAANKIDGIRCALSFNQKHAASTRKDDDTNMLALPADYLSHEDALRIIDTWLTTPFSQEERFERRIEEIKKLEKES
ncbi:MAG: RpiB/LacA/LacB family sugar-phosphate isomerase [Patescibacteria group bacterium]